MSLSKVKIQTKYVRTTIKPCRIYIKSSYVVMATLMPNNSISHGSLTCSSTTPCKLFHMAFNVFVILLSSLWIISVCIKQWGGMLTLFLLCFEKDCCVTNMLLILSRLFLNRSTFGFRRMLLVILKILFTIPHCKSSLQTTLCLHRF